MVSKNKYKISKIGKYVRPKILLRKSTSIARTCKIRIIIIAITIDMERTIKVSQFQKEKTSL